MSKKQTETKLEGPIHIILNPKSPGKFDPVYGHLELEKAGPFSASIKEYLEATEKIKKEAAEAEKFINSKVLNSEEYNKLTPGQRATYDANVAVFNKGSAKRTAEKTALSDTFKNVGWIWQLVGKGIETSVLTFNEKIGLGVVGNIARYDYKSFYFPELLEGGGKAWLEPYDTTGQAVGKVPHGLYISAKGSPRVIDTLWTDTNYNVIEEKNVKFGSNLILHVYTRGLYGQGLDVKLIDHDYFSYDDDLLLAEDKGMKDFSFKRGVDVTKLKAYEEGRPGISGTLIEPVDAKKGTGAKSTSYVQKCEIPVYIDPAWKPVAGGALQIYPIVKSAETGIYFEGFPRKYLSVKEDGKLYEQPGISGNNVMMVNDVETNIAAFHPCGYSVISVKNNERNFEIYKQNEKPFEANFEVVAGTLFTQQVTVYLNDNASTVGCSFKDKPDLYHKGRVITIEKYPERGIATKDEQNSHSKFTAQSTTKVSIGPTFGEKNKHIISLDGIKLKIDTQEDKKLVFQSRFIYDTREIANLPYVFRYFWLGAGATTCNYVIHIDSCRHKRHTLNVLVYPDIRWSLRLEYKNMKSEYIKKSIEAISNQTYKDTKAARFKRQPTKWTTPDKQGRTFGISLKAKFNNKPAGYQVNAEKTYSTVRNEGEEWDLSEEISTKFEKTVKAINQIADLIDSTLGGKRNSPDGGAKPGAEHQQALDSIKKNKNNQELDKLRTSFENNRKALSSAAPDSKEYKDAVKNNESLQRKMDSKGLELGLKPRSVVGVELYMPEIALEFDWSRVPVKNPGYEHKFNKTGVFLEGVIEAKPLFGIKAYLDFLALAQRAHPIALALIAAADIALKLIGDGSQIVLELSATMIIGGKMQGFFNTETGENTFNAKDRDANSKAPAEISGEITVKVTASFKANISKRALFIVVKAEVELSLEAEAKFYVKSAFDYDDYGFFFVPEFSFDGIQLKGKANIKADMGEAEGSAFVKLDSKNEFVYQAIDRQAPKKADKLYFRS